MTRLQSKDLFLEFRKSIMVNVGKTINPRVHRRNKSEEGEATSSVLNTLSSQQDATLQAMKGKNTSNISLLHKWQTVTRKGYIRLSRVLVYYTSDGQSRGRNAYACQVIRSTTNVTEKSRGRDVHTGHRPSRLEVPNKSKFPFVISYAGRSDSCTWRRSTGAYQRPQDTTAQVATISPTCAARICTCARTVIRA